ncbi:uncharacterized protein LOC111373947 [Olea europaea var. sylvestris]|uniref:uncharacterized protein LOC111373947 n=1 Tax=Olea europaea var. sylvestris TaxID=158386 RepID=UPI000C1CECC5|nr:uncharacterized protein LOC111373947 [Olea europaea var. sylvestris]
MGDSLFSILVDETRDNSINEQMAVVLRFVDKSGKVKERLLGISHVTDTCAQSLKDAIDAMLSTYRLSISSLRSQGYDRASNMSGEFNGLKALILRENPYAIYIHCFAHQLQLAVVTVARTDHMLGDFFNMLAIIGNLVGASCKLVDSLRASYYANILEKLNIGELTNGTNQFQEMSLAHPGETRWGSHLLTITRFISIFNAVIDVLENISEDDKNIGQKSMANKRDNGWDTLLSKVIEFYVDRHISVPNMEDIVVMKGRPRRAAQFVLSSFDQAKLVRLPQFYPLDFNSDELLLLRPELDKFVMLMRMDEAFFNLKSISCVVQKLIETRSSCYFPLVYRLITLVLILPVATASFERVVPAWLSCLPIKGDLIEVKVVHEQLCTMVERFDRELLGPNNQYLPKIVAVFVEEMFEALSAYMIALLYCTLVGLY